MPAGKTSGWAFPGNSTAAFERTGANSWKKVRLPGPSSSVQAAAAFSPSSVWAARGTQLDRWNGRGWAVAKSFRGLLSGVSVLGRNDVWAFGGEASGGGVFHFNGRSWTEVSATFQGGSAVSDRDVWAVSGQTVEHFNGRTWSATSVTGLFPPGGGLPVSPFLLGILALGPGNVYATGVGYASVGGGSEVVLHFNGRSWSRVAAGAAVVGSRQSVASDGKGGLWIVVDTHQNYLRLLRYSAGSLTTVTLPPGTGPVSVSRVPGTAEALLGGFKSDAGVVEQYS